MRERQISNVFTLGGAACALAWLLATGHSWVGAQASDAGWALAIVLLLTLPGYMFGRFGAGDVKLLGALALATSQAYVLGTFIGAGGAMLLWALARRLWRRGAGQAGDKQPFAPSVLVGFVLASVCLS
ncbi:type 4 prepilin peptidase 1 [Pseudomonas sp. KU43P]|nr:type 4 prepilin peptidase 1 [Pseudomonas sp. KU43P]